MSDILVFVKFNQTANTGTAMLSTTRLGYAISVVYEIQNIMSLQLIVESEANSKFSTKEEISHLAAILDGPPSCMP